MCPFLSIFSPVLTVDLRGAWEIPAAEGITKIIGAHKHLTSQPRGVLLFCTTERFNSEDQITSMFCLMLLWGILRMRMAIVGLVLELIGAVSLCIIYLHYIVLLLKMSNGTDVILST